MSFLRLSAVLLAASLAACAHQPNIEAAARQELVRRNISIDLRGLKEATQSRDLDGAYLFEDVGFFAGISNADFKEALLHAASTDNYGLHAMLTRHGKDIRYPAGELASSLDKAVKNGSVRMAGLLIHYGAKPGDASLLHAAYKDDYDLVALLLAKGATLDTGENMGAVNMAARLGHLNSVRAFVESGKAPAGLVSRAIIYAALREQIEVVKYLVGIGVDINHEDRDGCSALHFLAQDGSVDMIKFMVENGAEVNKTCRGSETPLKWASYGDNAAVMDYLVSVGGTKK
jgi:hypothetical protein